jgi:hypothetical protein
MVIVCWALLNIWNMLNMYGILEFGSVPIYIQVMGSIAVYCQILFPLFYALVMWLGLTQKNGVISKVTKNAFLTLHWHNIHCQQRELSKFLMHYQQFTFHAYCGAAGPVPEMALCVLRFEMSRSVIGC